MVNRTLSFLVAVFLLLNLATRLYALHNHGSFFNGLLLAGGGLSLLVWIRPGFLKLLCFLLGFSLPLYGFQSYTLYNHVFEFWLVLLGCLLLFSRDGGLKCSQKPQRIVSMLAGYALLSFFSLQLLPMSSFFDSISLWGLFDFANGVFSATPENPWYSLAAGNRLALLCLVILLLSWNPDGEVLYKRFFVGCALSVFVVCLLGILNQFEIISLACYRPKFWDASGVDRLHSVFGNPGWFAEYVLICTPFVLLLFGRKTDLRIRLLMLTAVLVLIGISLLLTGSRTSWLLFPLAMFFCYAVLLLFNSARNGRAITWQGIWRSCMQVGLGGLLLCLIGGSVFWVVDRISSSRPVDGSLSRTEYILQRIRNITVPEERGKVWTESLAMVSESPVYGLGYESYRWHHGVMSSVPDSRFAQQRRTTANWDTAHNLYIQLAVSNGVVGLIVWLGLTGYVALVLLQDGVANRNIQSFVLLGSLGLFHLYGVTQSMQYVASIWFFMFMIIGYAILLDLRLLSPKLISMGRYGGTAVLVAAVTGGIIYGNNFQSQQLAKRYNLPRYDQYLEGDLYKGFYWREDWGKDGYFRWSGRNAEIVLSGSGMVQVDFACYAPRLDHLPLTLEVSFNGHPVDSYTFREAKKVTRTYSIPDGNTPSPATLQLQVSRTWTPKRENMGNDTRILGVAVSEPTYFDEKIVGDGK